MSKNELQLLEQVADADETKGFDPGGSGIDGSGIWAEYVATPGPGRDAVTRAERRIGTRSFNPGGILGP